MKAIIRDRYGSPDVLGLEDIDPPEVGDAEVLVDVAAAAVNRGDVLEMRGWPYLARVAGYGMRRPRRRVPGTDTAGVVTAVGSAVDDVAVGDAVVGWSGGAFAEQATMARASLVKVTAGVGLTDTAALPTAGAAALQAVRDAGQVQSGHEVLVVGASGAVGAFAVQIAVDLGARVTGVAGTRNVELVRDLGATAVLDYSRTDFTDHPGWYDVIVDLVGNQPLGRVRRVLDPAGILVVVGGDNPRSLTGMSRFASAALRSPFLRQRLVPLVSKPSTDDLAHLIELVGAGRLRPAIGRTFDLTDTAQALHHVESGHSRGQVVVTTGRRRGLDVEVWEPRA